ncbi:MAG TPA: ABC transporter permease, partial [Haloferula sp.]
MLSSFSLISLVGVTLGVLALVVVMAVFAGLERNVKQRYLESLPHILLTGDHLMAREEADEMIARVKQLPGVESATAYVADNVVIDAPSDQHPVDFRAVDTSDPTQVEGLKKLFGPEADPDSSDLGIDDRVIISSLVAKSLGIAQGDKIRLISTRNVREVMKIFKTTERPPVHEAFKDQWSKISGTLQSGWKGSADANTLPIEQWRETYTLLQAIYEDDIRQVERDRVEAILLAMD